MGERRYFLLAALLVVVYAAVGVTLNATRDFDERGPLSYPSAATADVPREVLTAAQASERCSPQRSTPMYRYVVVAGEVLDELYVACYKIDRSSGWVEDAVLLDADGRPVTDVMLLKAAGVWPRIAAVSTGRGLVTGFITVVAVVAGGWIYYRKPRPGPPLQSAAGRLPRWQRPGSAWLLVLLPVITWIPFARTRSISSARKIRILFQAAFIVVALVTAGQLSRSVTVGDSWGLWVFGLVAAAMLVCVFGGLRWLAHADFDHPEEASSGTSKKGEAPPRPGPTQTDRQPSPPIPELPPSIPEPNDVAIRQFRAAAQSRLILSILLRWIAIAFAIPFTVFGLVGGVWLALVGAVEASGLHGMSTGIVAVVIVLLLFYSSFFVAPGVGVALLALPLIFGWRDPTRILLLRPFNRADHSRPLRGLVRREVAGYGHTYTLADVAISVRWYVTVPVLLGQLGLLSFRFRRVTGPPGLERLARAVEHRRRRNLNWAVARSKVFAVRCTDEMWQHAVRQMTPVSDAVLIDVTDLTGNLAWELALLRPASPPGLHLPCTTRHRRALRSGRRTQPGGCGPSARVRQSGKAGSSSRVPV